MVYIPFDVDIAVRRKCKRLRHSQRTAKNYLYWIHRFLLWSRKELGKVSKKDVSAFLQMLDNQGLSGNTLNQAHMAIKFLFEDVMERKMWINIRYVKVPKKIQRMLTKQEVRQLLNSISNWKHRLMIELMYSAGLRVSEVVNLKVKDLVLDSNYGFVRNGKGGKDRLFILARIVKEKIKNLIEIEDLNSEDFVFISNRNGKYNVKSLQVIVKKAAKLAKINNWKEVHCHTLRHSFATHLIENNYSVSDVQASLGHKSPETSLGYIHSNGKMLSIKSPLDSI